MYAENKQAVSKHIPQATASRAARAQRKISDVFDLAAGVYRVPREERRGEPLGNTG